MATTTKKKATTVKSKTTAKKAVKKSAPKVASASKKTLTKKSAPKKTVKKETPSKAALAAASPKKQTRAQFLKEIKKTLEQERTQIIGDVALKIKDSTNAKNEIGDIYDKASEERERELNLTFGDRDREKLSQIEEAMEKIHDKTYGECEECGEPIGEGRIRALPFTASCIDCKSKEEKQLGRGHIEEDAAITSLGKGADPIQTEDDI